MTKSTICNKIFANGPYDIMVAGPINVNSKQLMSFYDAILGICDKLGKRTFCAYKFSNPHKTSNVTPEEVYNICKELVSKSKLLLAYVGHPSIGTGQELEIAVDNEIPIILIYEKKIKISKMVLGNPAIIKKIAFTDYKEATQKIQIAIKKYFEKN